LKPKKIVPVIGISTYGGFELQRRCVKCIRVEDSSSYRGDEFQLKGGNKLRQIKFDERVEILAILELQRGTTVRFIKVKCQKNSSYRGEYQKFRLIEVKHQNNSTSRGATLPYELFELSAPVPQLFE